MHRALPLLALAVVACQNPERDELLNWLDDYDYERTGVRVQLCACPSELGYASSDECEADAPAYSAGQKECIADAFDGTESRGVDFYSCATPALREYSECLIDYSDACAPSWSQVCTDAYEAALADCPALSSSTTSAVSACVE